MLLTQDLSHLPGGRLHQLALFAWEGDRKRAGAFVSEVIRQRLEAVDR